MKFDARPPTNGKALTAEDVLFSWKQFETLSGTRRRCPTRRTPARPFCR